MSKTLTPEEFEAENSIVDKMPVEYLTKWEFAEAYANYLHKAKVESIVDEEIELFAEDKYNGYNDSKINDCINFTKEFLQKLLKQ